MCIGVLLHLAAIPYADLTLLSANSSMAIVLNIFLSISLFDEKFLWRYDLPAILFIISGSTIIVLISNKKKSEISGQELLDILKSDPAIFYYVFQVIFTLLSFTVLHFYYKALRTFENDADLHGHNIRSQNGDKTDPLKLVFPPVIVPDEAIKEDIIDRDEEIATQDELNVIELS
jgi:hypothetical protein